MVHPTLILLGVAIVFIIFGFFASRKPKAAPTALNEREYKQFPLIKKSPTQRLGLPVGRHIMLRFKDEKGSLVSRPYTPVTSDDEPGYFDLVIKVYPARGEIPAGRMGTYLSNLPVGSKVEVRGPLGEINYKGNGKFTVKRKAGKDTKAVDYNVKRIGMIAGGSGITPMLQIVRDVCKNKDDKTELYLIFGNILESDILLRQELDEYAHKYKNFKCFYTLDKPSDGWKHGRGFVTAEMIKEHIPPPSNDMLLLFCGPPRMIDHLTKLAQGLDYTPDNIFAY